MSSQNYGIDENPRDALTSSIKAHISKERLEKALKVSRSARADALENIVKDAVRNSGVVSFNGIPHIWVRKWGIYIQFDYNTFKVSIYDAMRRAGVPDGCYGGIDRLVKLCWAETQSNRKDIDTSIVVMANGVFDTMDMQLHEFDPKYLTNMRVPYEYNSFEVPVGWKNFLERVLPDLDMQMLLQEFLAATYVDRRYAKIEHMLILLGSGANGKSVVFEVVSGLLGENNISNFSISDLTSSTKRVQNVAKCNGMRLNYCSEIQTAEITTRNADAFKVLVSGESQMAQSLYKEPFRADSIPLLMANANTMPRIENASYSIQRRILVIPFEVFIPEDEQDKELASYLKTELSGIFNWVMSGLARLRENKYQLDVPMKVSQIVNEYVQSGTPVSRWMSDQRIFPHWKNNQFGLKGGWFPTMEIFAMYERWRIHNGEDKMSKKAFYEQLDINGFKRTRRSQGMGYDVYIAPNDDEILKMNMELAIRLEKQNAIEELRKQVDAAGLIEVSGIHDLEAYLGLPRDSIWVYRQTGLLSGCSRTLPDGRSIYDIRACQVALAKNGFYQTLASPDSNLKRKSLSVLNGMRKTFNAQMKQLGLPIRKHSNQNSYIPMADRDCWIVPDDWEYSKKAAEAVMSGPK